ncbi:MAG: UvrD-helicase domain-containing protein [Spirochaetales bacterium]|nr:UvrD-helicase domain-containing protein [Spirochaetales bacterium]
MNNYNLPSPNLEPSKIEAITTTESPLLILAGPGSGKTLTIVERVLYLLVEKLVASSEILVATFTGMLIHGQSDFMISYIDPESHTLRHYFPDFLIKKKDGSYSIVEIKGDNRLDDPVVSAKKEYARSLAMLNNMTYDVVPGSEALRGYWA